MRIKKIPLFSKNVMHFGVFLQMRCNGKGVKQDSSNKVIVPNATSVLIYINTYIIGHYNPSVRITA